MAYTLVMPKQGNTVESCIISEWKVKEGDTVAADTVVCVVETDKATVDVAAGEAGAVLKILYEAGDDVPVMKAIAVIGAKGEDIGAVLAKISAEDGGNGEQGGGSLPSASRSEAHASRSDAHASRSDAHPSAGGQPPVTPPVGGEGFVSPRARNLADSNGITVNVIQGSGPHGRVIERDVQAALSSGAPLTAAAKALGAAAPGMVGSGIGGRVTSADMADVGAQLIAPPQSVAHLQADSAADTYTDTPVKGIRKVIADRMLQSLSESAQFTLNNCANASAMQNLRKRFKSADETLGLCKITVNDLLLFAVSRVLPRFSFMNAHKLNSKDGASVVRTFSRVHLGMAVDTPRGLMVPVIRNADLLSLRQISAEAKRLAKAAQEGTIKPDELSGSTFTVTNLGSMGVTSFTPVINMPEVAILGVCGIELKPVENAEGGDESCCGIAFEPHIALSLTINHQVVDGAPAAKFLKALGDAVKEIDLWLAM